jgi:hypothetical protein
MGLKQHRAAPRKSEKTNEEKLLTVRVRKIPIINQL